MYQEWINNISKSEVTLDRIKLCICGFTRVGKSAMRQSLSKPYLRVSILYVHACFTVNICRVYWERILKKQLKAMLIVPHLELRLLLCNCQERTSLVYGILLGRLIILSLISFSFLPKAQFLLC